MKISINVPNNLIARKDMKPRTVFRHPGSSNCYLCLGNEIFTVTNPNGSVVKYLCVDLATGSLLFTSHDTMLEIVGELNFTP